MQNKRTRFIDSFPKGEEVVSMMDFKGAMYIATNKRIYYVGVDNTILPLRIQRNNEQI